MIKNLTIETLGTFLWVYVTLNLLRLENDKTLDDQAPLANAIADFLLIFVFYIGTIKVTTAHLNPVISIAAMILKKLTYIEVH